MCSDERVYDMLYTACKTGNTLSVQRILEDLKSTETIAASDDAGEIPVDCVQVSTSVSQLVCHRSRNTLTTLLHLASQSGHVSIVRLLLAAGADPCIKYAAVMSVVECKYLDIVFQTLNSCSLCEPRELIIGPVHSWIDGAKGT